MSIIAINTNKRTATATAHLPYAAYKHACELATALEGTIGRTDDNLFTATFAKAKTAKEFAEKWTADYAEAHKAYTSTHTNAQKPSASKGNKTSSSKKNTKSGKGNTFNFNKVKGKTNSEKNKALHKMLVDMGIADSRTPEYMSVWNARPWAK